MKILNIWGKLPNVFVKTYEVDEYTYYKTVLVNGKYRLYKLYYNNPEQYSLSRYWNNNKQLIGAVKDYVGVN